MNFEKDFHICYNKYVVERSNTDLRACSSAGRAPRSQRGGRRFDPDHVQNLRTLRK